MDEACGCAPSAAAAAATRESPHAAWACAGPARVALLLASGWVAFRMLLVSLSAGIAILFFRRLRDVERCILDRKILL